MNPMANADETKKEAQPGSLAVRCSGLGPAPTALEPSHRKRRLNPHLLPCRSRDIASRVDDTAFLARVCTDINSLRVTKIAEETARLRRRPAPPCNPTSSSGLKLTVLPLDFLPDSVRNFFFVPGDFLPPWTDCSLRGGVCRGVAGRRG
ncbi:MAG: hypothetical protein EXS40_08935 [Opitutaceae bacterium]|nr:hypothetical protein [Opitutaceae bacterium]